MTTSLPTYTLTDNKGETCSFPNGRFALFCFVHEECDTCDTSFPLLETAYQSFGRKMDIWAIGQDTEGNHQLIQRHNLTLPVLDDSLLRVSFSYNIDTVPTIILANENGEETRRFIGFGKQDWKDLYDELANITEIPHPEVEWNSYPEIKPGCGSKSVLPGIAERLLAEATGSPIRARRIELPSAVDPYEFIFQQGLTDGLPVIPPTPERVVNMLSGTQRDSQEIVAVVPPNMAPASVEKIAINSVMAGCKPEYLPVVIAALEAVCTDTFNIHGVMATTMGGSPVIVVNGPIRKKIGMNMEINALGQGNRANATIGRALRLVIRNIGGAKPSGTERAALGSPMKYTLSFAEFEEHSPWDPLHVERGFSPEDSVVTVFGLTGGPQIVADERSRTGKALAGSLGLGLEAISHPKARGIGDVLLVVCSEHAETFRKDGWSKEQIRQRIQDVSLRPLRELISNEDSGAGAMAQQYGPSGPSKEQLEELIPKFRDLKNIHMVVAGGPAGKWSAAFSGWSSIPTSQKIEEVP